MYTFFINLFNEKLLYFNEMSMNQTCKADNKSSFMKYKKTLPNNL